MSSLRCHQKLAFIIPPSTKDYMHDLCQMKSSKPKQKSGWIQLDWLGIAASEMGHEAKNGQLTCNIFWGDIKKNQVICPRMVIEAKRLGMSATVENSIILKVGKQYHQQMGNFDQQMHNFKKQKPVRFKLQQNPIQERSSAKWFLLGLQARSLPFLCLWRCTTVHWLVIFETKTSLTQAVSSVWACRRRWSLPCWVRNARSPSGRDVLRNRSVEIR